MGLRETNSIDIILQAPPFETEPCKLLLIIVDATSDLDDATRFDLLLKKLAAYMFFVTSPDFSREHPALHPEDVLIRVLTVTPPTTLMKQVDAIRSRNGSSRLRVLFDDYNAFMRRIKSGGEVPRLHN